MMLASMWSCWIGSNSISQYYGILRVSTDTGKHYGTVGLGLPVSVSRLALLDCVYKYQ